MGELINCPRCDKVFVRLKRGICPDCVKAEEDLFEAVRLFLKNNPGVTIEEIAKEFDVEENLVLKWLREGRIEEAGIGLKMTCQMCNIPIRIGTLCSKCAQLLTSEMANKARIEKQQQESSKPVRRMFTVDRYKDDD